MLRKRTGKLKYLKTREENQNYDNYKVYTNKSCKLRERDKSMVWLPQVLKK